MLFIIEEAKGTILDFSQGTVKVLWMCSTILFCFNILSVKWLYKMTQYNTLNVKLSNWQHNKLKSGIKNGTEVTLKLSSNIVGAFNGENNFPHKLLLTNTQVSRLHKAFASGWWTNVKLSKSQLHEIGQSGGFLGRLLGPLLKTGLPLMKNVLKPPTKSVLTPLGLTAAASPTEAAIHKKMFGSGTTTLIISNEETNDIMKIVKSLEECGLLIKDVSETVKNEAKEQKGGFLSMLLGTLHASLAGKGTIRAGQDF